MPSFKTELGKPDVSGLCKVYVRVTIPNKAKKKSELRRIEVPYRVSPKDWNPKTGRVRSTHPEHFKINEKISDKLREAESQYQERDGRVTAGMLQRIVQGSLSGDRISDDLLKLETQFADAGKGSTALSYQYVRRLVDDYVPGLTVGELNEDELYKFESWLRKRGIGSNSISLVIMPKLKQVVKAALKARQIKVDDNPFLFYSCKTVKTYKEKLNRSEIELLENAVFKRRSNKDLARDFYLFSFYIGGARATDVLKLKERGNVLRGRLNYRASKTGKLRSVRLHEKALAIIEKWRGGKHIFPYADSAKWSKGDAVEERKAWLNLVTKLNGYMIQVEREVGLTKKLRTHVARHTAADLIRREFKDTKLVQKMLDHSKESTTATYVSDLADDEMDTATDSLGG